VDQTVFDGIFLLFSERIITNFYNELDSPAREGRGIWPLDQVETEYLGACGSQWFYYQFWLASPKEREETRKLWLDNWSWSGEESWKNDWHLPQRSWWRERESCRLTPVRSLKQLLKRRYGEDWTPPARRLVIE